MSRGIRRTSLVGFLGLIGLLLWGVFVRMAAEAQAPVPISLDPTSLVLSPSQPSAQVTVAVGAGGSNLYGGSLDLEYDSAALNVSVRPGSLFQGNGQENEAGGYFQHLQTTPGGLTWAVTLLRPAPPVNSPGEMALLTVECRAFNGQTYTLTLAQARLVQVDPNDEQAPPTYVETQLQNAQLTVECKPSRLFLDPPALSTGPGATFTLNLRAENIPTPGVAGFTLDVTFDPNAVSLTSVTFSDDLQNWLTDWNEQNGVLKLTGASGTPKPGSFSIAALSFQVTAPEGTTTQIGLAAREFVDDNNNPIPVNVAGSVLTVQARRALFRLVTDAEGNERFGVVRLAFLRLVDAQGQEVAGGSLAGVTGDILFDPDLVEVVGAVSNVQGATFQINPVEGQPGRRRLALAAPTGVPPEAPLVTLFIRLKGPVTRQATLTFEPSDAATPEGPVGVAPPNENPERSLTLMRSDVNGDGQVGQIFDAVLALQFIVGKRSASELVVPNLASVAHDDPQDKVSISDVVFILQYIVGKRDENMNRIQ